MTAWQAGAACATADPALFFPDEAGRQHDYTEARAICGGCEVRGACLEAGLRERFGMWAGLTPNERAKLARQRADMVACAGCGVAVARNTRGAREPWCGDEACERERSRRRTEEYRRRRGAVA